MLTKKKHKWKFVAGGDLLILMIIMTIAVMIMITNVMMMMIMLIMMLVMLMMMRWPPILNGVDRLKRDISDFNSATETARLRFEPWKIENQFVFSQ